MRRWADFCRELRELGELGEGEGAFRDGLIWAANCANWGGEGAFRGGLGVGQHPLPEMQSDNRGYPGRSPDQAWACGLGRSATWALSDRLPVDALPDR